METAAAEIGSTANSYQVLAKLATGGMAEIFLARSAGVAAVQRHVVLKRVLRDRATDINFVRMFLDEARLAAQLQHPNIAQVYDVGKLGDSYFFTMEYVHGETVRSLVQRALEARRSPPLGCVLAITAGAAAGLHHAHERIGIEGRPLGIVHRDVSPSNLMVGYDGSVKVVDFGVAKAADRVHETQSGAVKGKISYLSPEQARGQKLDARSDLFSLGIVMWELLTVDRLYKHDSDFETMSAIINEPAPPPSSRRRDLPPELDHLVLKLLAKHPDDRYQSAEELADAIERVAVQVGAAMSAASVSRFVRELFGNRREPWHELQGPIKGKDPEVVTVTSEPIPNELKIPINDPIDRRLAVVVDLSVSSPAPVEHTELVDRPTTAYPIPPEPVSVITRVPRRLSPIVIVAVVLALAVVAGVAIALVPSSNPAATPDELTARPEGSAPVAIVESITDDASTGATQPADDPITDAAVAAEEPVPSIDTPDAGDATPEAIDAGAATPRVKKPPSPKPPPPKPPKKPARPDDGSVIADCTDGAITDMATCTLAACRLRNTSKAKLWYVRLSVAGRAAVAKSCAAAGVDLAPPKRDCDADPRSCP